MGNSEGRREGGGNERVSVLRRLSRESLVAPGSTKVWVFAVMDHLGRLPVLREIKYVVRYLFVDLAPTVPVSLRNSMSGVSTRQAAVLGAFTTFFFCLVVPAVWTLAIGRFSSDEPGKLFFLQDWRNVVLYAFVCPLYVALGCWLIVSAIHGWSEIRSLARRLEPAAERAPRRTLLKGALLVLLVLAMGLFSTTAYIHDILNKSRVTVQYWFMEVTAGGEHTIGALGVYYFLLNFVLLMITLMSIVFFMSVFVSTFGVGDALRARADVSGVEFEELKARLSVFTEVYLVAKLLTFTYMVNFYIWKASPLGATQNIYTAYIFLTLFGVLFVSFPRYYVELQWFRLRVRSGEVRPGEDVYDDIRSLRARDIASFADVVIIGSFTLGMFKELFLSGGG